MHGTSAWRPSLITNAVAGLALLALLCGKYSFSLDPEKAFSQYIRTSWTTEAGLPQTSVYSIAQTRDGYLWVGTEQGLASFDGVRFRAFNQNNVPALPANYIHRLLAGRDGSLWIGTDSGLTRYDGKTWTTWTTRTGLTNDDIQALAEGKDGSLWVGAHGGLNRLRNGRIDAWHVKDGLPDDRIAALQVDPRGTLWIATRKGLASFDGDRFRSYPLRGGAAPPDLSALALAPDGSVWCASVDGLLARQSGAMLAPVPVKLPHNDVQAMLFDHDGNLWLGFPRGLARLHEGQLTLVDAHDGLRTEIVKALFEDDEHNLWVGTFDCGLLQLRDGRFSVFGPPEGLPSAAICCSVETPDGATWVGAEGGALVAIRPGATPRTYTTRDGLPLEGIHSMLLARDGALWIGHRHGVLTRFRNGRFRSFRSTVAKDAAINGLLEDRRGQLWIGTYGAGLMRFQDGRFVPVLPDLEVLALAQTSDGAIWIGADGDGLIEFKDGASQRYTDANGLPNNHVVSLWVDRDDTVWVGFMSGGLSRIRNRQIVSFTAAQGLFDSTVANLMPDDFGNLWMGSDSGIARVSEQQLQAFAEQRAPLFHSIGYDTADGLRSRETMQGGTGCGTRSKDGKLWFPTMNGLASLDPRRALQADPPLRVRIENLQLGAYDLAPQPDIRFRHDAERVSIQFTALTFIAPTRVRFRYRLDGYDTRWVETVNSRAAVYTNLPPGHYRFRVQAARYNGDWEPNTAALPFVVAPSWFETPAAWLLWIAGACLLTWGIVRVRTRTLVRRRHELQRLVAARTRQLNEEKAALAAAREELQEQATHDSLTGLWNRKAILELLDAEIERSLRENTPLSVVMADLDHFKKINDTHGHLCGDRVLAQAAHGLQTCLRSYDSMGRYGGEEFLILMQGCDPVRNADRFVELLASVGSREFTTGPARLQVTCSLGVTAFWPGHAEVSAEELLAAADRGLYEAKRLGRNRIEYVELSALSHFDSHR